MRYLILIPVIAALWLLFSFVPEQEEYDIVLRNATIYDGSGTAPYNADLAINGDRIAAIGNLSSFRAKREIDVHGMATAPGFINMLSWADVSLLHDGTSMSDIKQGVTLEVFGEGWSPGPVKRNLSKPGRLTVDHTGRILAWAMKKGVSPNIASFVGATTVRLHEVGHEKRAPTPAELSRMKALVAQAMEQGAMGLGSSLIYAPADYASTEELIALGRRRRIL